MCKPRGCTIYDLGVSISNNTTSIKPHRASTAASICTVLGRKCKPMFGRDCKAILNVGAIPHSPRPALAARAVDVCRLAPQLCKPECMPKCRPEYKLGYEPKCKAKCKPEHELDHELSAGPAELQARVQAGERVQVQAGEWTQVRAQVQTNARAQVQHPDRCHEQGEVLAKSQARISTNKEIC